MLGDRPAYAGIHVDDAATARKFYEGVLGLSVSDTVSDADGACEDGRLTLHLAGAQRVVVIPRSDHVPSRHPVLTFIVEDINAAMAELGHRGVEFLRYREYEQADGEGVHVPRGQCLAWFCDPAGNVLSLRQEA
jgi:catechol 2,3-dioxygenase-like lactoylglutathione lyase family enzyme